MSEGMLKVYGAHWCPDCRRTRRFLAEHRVPYEWIDLEAEPEARRYVEEVNGGRRIIPTLIFPDGSILAEPSDAELARKLDLRTRAQRTFYDVLVIGGGPAGLTAALYLAREGAEVLVVEKGGLGGQAAVTQKIDNLPGFPDGITGAEFAERLTRQVERYGVEVLRAQEVIEVRSEEGVHEIRTGDGARYGARAVLLAVGATYRRLAVPGEEERIGAGIHFCATCDGPFYRDQRVAVIGGGNSATEESLFLTRFASHVLLLVREEALQASPVLAEKVLNHPKIRVHVQVDVQGFEGRGGKLERIRLLNRASGREEELEVSGAFVFIGQQPNTAFLKGTVALDRQGFILTGHELEHRGLPLPRPPAPMETSLPGVFAAGDARAGSTKQIASAAGEGAAAALQIRDSLKR